MESRKSRSTRLLRIRLAQAISFFTGRTLPVRERILMRVMNPGCWSARTAVTGLTVLLLALIACPGMLADTQSPPDPNKNPGGGEKAGPGSFSLPSVSVRPADRGRLRTSAREILGWRLGVRTDAFGSITFSDAAMKADAAGLSSVEGVSTQQVSAEIPKHLDYHLTPDEVSKVKNRLDELRLRMPAYYLDTLPADEGAQRKSFEFAKELGADMVIVPAEPASFAALDKLANEVGMNVAVVNGNTQSAMAALAPSQQPHRVERGSRCLGKGRDSAARWIGTGKEQAARRGPAQRGGYVRISSPAKQASAACSSTRLAAGARWRRQEIRRQASFLHAGSSGRRTCASG